MTNPKVGTLKRLINLMDLNKTDQEKIFKKNTNTNIRNDRGNMTTNDMEI